MVKETLPQLTPVQRRALETALLMREPDGPPPEVRLLGLALLSVVRALAQDGSLLVGIDDVQWVDASSAEVLTIHAAAPGGRAGGCSRNRAWAAR